MTQKKGIILILISAIMFGSYGVWSKLIGDSFGSFYQGWTRALTISIILLPILIYKKEIKPIAKKDRRWLAVFLIFTSLTQAPIFYAYNHMDISSASLLFFVTMLLTMYSIGFLFLGEKTTRIKLTSFIMAIIGIYIIFSFSLKMFTLFAAMMAILNGIASGGELSSTKKLSGNYSALYISWLSWLIIIVTNMPVSLLLKETQHIPSLHIVWAYHLGYAMTSILAFWFVIEGLKYTEASIGGLVGLLEIVSSILFGILLFNEELSAKIILGGTLIILASALPHLSELKSINKKPNEDIRKVLNPARMKLNKN